MLARLRAARPGLSVTSDFIVGFPGETDSDFEQTMQLIDAVAFDGAFSFAYSQRPGTPAADLPDQVPAATKQARLEHLQARLDALYRGYSERMIGTTQRVLVDGHARKNRSELSGRADNNRYHRPGDS